MNITEEAIKEFLNDLNENVWTDLSDLVTGNRAVGVDDTGAGPTVQLLRKAATSAEKHGVKPVQKPDVVEKVRANLASILLAAAKGQKTSASNIDVQQFLNAFGRVNLPKSGEGFVDLSKPNK